MAHTLCHLNKYNLRYSIASLYVQLFSKLTGSLFGLWIIAKPQNNLLKSFHLWQQLKINYHYKLSQELTNMQNITSMSGLIRCNKIYKLTS